MVAAGFTRTQVTQVTSLGDRLRAARALKRASLGDAELATSVATKYLRALEQGHLADLPAEVYVVGFLRRYARWLALDPTEVITAYRQEVALAAATRPHTVLSRSQLVRPLQPLVSRPILMTPERFVGVAVSVGVLLVIGYVWFQVKSFAAAPPLDVATAVDNQVVSVDTLTLAGSTDAAATLVINGQTVPVDPTGRFSATIRLVDGVNTIELRAQNRTDKETVKVLKVLATLADHPGAPGAELPLQPIPTADR
jgi:cytoskeletal protein RodZ